MSHYPKEPKKLTNAWNRASQQNNQKKNGVNGEANLKNSEKKFKETQEKLKIAAQKHIKNYESSSDEDDLEADNIINNILREYSDKDLLGRTGNFLNDAFVSRAATCLICISTIKRNEPIWSCIECYCFFHLMCIQRWSKDTIVQQKLAMDSQIIVRQIKLAWGCPKCRFEYGPDDVPTEYLCFCKKTANPQFQPLIIPHSCGEICGKTLKPLCGHNCLLLCHPGPCPPCPKTVKASCFCKAQPEKLQRCSNKEWSCGSECGKLLSCGKHKCSKPCHGGECPTCKKKSVQKCLCKSSQKLRDCNTPSWQCDKVCGKTLDCGNHKCLEVCHSGDCGSCILSKSRTCPCGKTSYELPCTEDTPICGDTCGKLLECGQHVCHQRCHKDKCSQCVEIVEKRCRCGLHTKEVPCKKQYLCDTKCKQLKDCGKHPCNRKCCDGNCPPCEKPCGRNLSCNKHSCSSICHRGPCFPCQLTEKVSCRCSSTVITVPCGKKHKTKPPKCMKPCMIPTDCHHPKREMHRCHFGSCPPCRLMCSKPHLNCQHVCPEPCHSSVLVKIEGQKASMPWEETRGFEKKCLPCPDCVVSVPVTCLGGHETSNWPCHLAKPASCGRPCGRLLKCENHTCTLQCHVVESPVDDNKAGLNCENCEELCAKPRPEGCSHPCPRPCHPGLCPPCKQMVRIKCHCGLNQPYVACKEWTIEGDKEQLQSCGDQCPLNYPCGHRCRSNCHSNGCPNPEQCKKKVKVSCPCKRIKKEFTCDLVRKGESIIKCDDVCIHKKIEDKKLKELENEQKKKEEELKNKKELEKYEKIFQGKKKHKERKTFREVEEKSFFQKFWFVPVLIVILGSAFYFIQL